MNKLGDFKTGKFVYDPNYGYGKIINVKDNKNGSINVSVEWATGNNFSNYDVSSGTYNDSVNVGNYKSNFNKARDEYEKMMKREADLRASNKHIPKITTPREEKELRAQSELQKYKNYFRKIEDKQLKDIYKAIKDKSISSEKDLLNAIKNGDIIPLEEMYLDESHGNHDYLEIGKTKNKFTPGNTAKGKSIIGGVKTISITSAGSTLFGDKFYDTEVLKKKIAESQEKIKELENKIDASKDIVQKNLMAGERDKLKKYVDDLNASIKKSESGVTSVYGTTFHSFAELLSKGKFPGLKDAAKSGNKNAVIDYIKKVITQKGFSQDYLLNNSNITGFTKDDSDLAKEFVEKIQSYKSKKGFAYTTMAEDLINYYDFLGKTGVNDFEAVEKSIGILTKINDQLVKYVGTIDAMFSTGIFDIKTGKVHPNEVAWQVNFGNFLNSIVSGTPEKKMMGAYNPRSSKFTPVGKIPQEIMNYLMVKAASGEASDIDLFKYVTGSYKMESDKSGNQLTYINNEQMPYATPKEEVDQNSIRDVEKAIHQAKEFVDSVRSLKGEDLEHAINQIFSVSEYIKGADKDNNRVESNKFIRTGFFWDKVREMLPYSMPQLYQYAIGATDTPPKDVGVGTKEYVIDTEDGVQDFTSVTVLGVTLKEWAKMANVLSELPDGMKKVRRLAELFEQTFNAMGAIDQKRVMSAYNKLMTNDRNVTPEYAKLLMKRKDLISSIRNARQDGNIDDNQIAELDNQLKEINSKLEEMKATGANLNYDVFEKAWIDVSSESSIVNRRNIVDDLLGGFKSVNASTEEKEANRAMQDMYQKDIDPFEGGEEKTYFYSRQDDDITKSQKLANRAGRLIDYADRVNNILQPFADENFKDVKDFSLDYLRDIGMTTGDFEKYNRYTRSLELSKGFREKFGDFNKADLKDAVQLRNVLDFLQTNLDKGITEEAEILNLLDRMPNWSSTTKTDKSGKSTTYTPLGTFSSTFQRRLQSSMFSDDPSVALEVLDELSTLKSKNLYNINLSNIEEEPIGHRLEDRRKAQEKTAKLREQAEQHYKELFRMSLGDAGNQITNKSLDTLKTLFSNLNEAQKEYSYISGKNVTKTGDEESDKRQEDELKSQQKEAKNKLKAAKSALTKKINSLKKSGVDIKSKFTVAEYQPKLIDYSEKLFENIRNESIASSALYEYRESNPEKDAVTDEEINEYLKLKAGALDLSLDDLKEGFKKEDIYTPFWKYLQNVSSEKGVTLPRVSKLITPNERIADDVAKTTADITADTISEAVNIITNNDEVKKVISEKVEESVADKTTADNDLKDKIIQEVKAVDAEPDDKLKEAITDEVAKSVAKSVRKKRKKVSKKVAQDINTSDVAEPISSGSGSIPPIDNIPTDGTSVPDDGKPSGKKDNERIKRYAALSKYESQLRIQQSVSTDQKTIDRLQHVVDIIQSAKQKLGEFNEEEQKAIENIEQRLSDSEFVKIAEAQIKTDLKARAAQEKEELKSEEKSKVSTEKSQKQDIRDYQQYVNKVISLESEIDKLQRQAALSGGKHKDAIYNTIDALNAELGDLNRNNKALKERVATEQLATKESIDATAALRKQSNIQKNLVSVKGATSIWDMMANDIRRATMRIADFGIAAKVLNKIPQDIQKVIQYTKELDAAMTNIRIVSGKSMEEAQKFMRGLQEIAQKTGTTLSELASGANEWLGNCLGHYKLL